MIRNCPQTTAGQQLCEVFTVPDQEVGQTEKTNMNLIGETFRAVELRDEMESSSHG